jgi:ATP-binding cassette, subfamily C (CFTR/MRP), member 1
VSISLDIIRVYSLWIIDGGLAVAILLTATEAVKLVILTLESWSKRSALREPYNTYSPETLSGIISRMWFLWLNPLLWLGYKGSLTLDMLSDLDPKMSTKHTSDRIISEWKKGMS